MLHSRYFVIYLLTFVNGLSMTMLFPVLPYVVQSYGQKEVVLWVLLWTFSLFQFIAAPMLWVLSDSYGRKPILLITQAGTFLSWIVLWAAYFMPETEIFWLLLLPIFVVFLSRMFDGITGWNASVAQAVLADMTPSEERSKVFGKNGAVFGMSLLIGPAMGSFSVSFSVSFLWTAILWAIISAITLTIMYIFLQETLRDVDRKKQVKIKFTQINVFAQILKWWHINTIRYALVMKLLIFIGFVSYTSVSALYLMDEFGFSASNIWYYLTFTGSFLIFHQSVSIQHFVKNYWDKKSLLFAICFMALWFIGMWLMYNIILFTVFYFIAVLGISLSFTTLWALFSRSADSKNQWEVLGMSSWLESLISIWVPIVATYLYWVISFSIFLLIWAMPMIALIVSIIFFRNVEYAKSN